MFFAQGVLALGNDDIVKLSGTYWGFNKALLDSFIAQRADYVSGVTAFGVAFVGQLAALMVSNRAMFDSELNGWLAVAGASALWLAILVAIRRMTFRRSVTNVEKLRQLEEKR